MNQEQIKLLTHMKKLIRNNKKRFAIRKDRDYLKELEIIGITEHEAWFNHILYLNNNMFFVDPKPKYKTNNNTLIFKKIIKNKLVYIKLSLEKEIEEEVVCLSFHIDNNGGNNYEM